MNRKVARPLGNGAIQRVNGIFNLPTELVNEKGETIFVLINTFNRKELFNLSNYWFSIHIKGSKYNTIETFISEEIKRLKIVQGWFDATKEKEYFFPIQHYIDYLEMNFKSDFEINNERNIKNQIAIKLIGLIEGDTTVFHYIKGVLKEYNITAIEGRDILLEMQGTFNDVLRKKRLPEVVKFLEDIKAFPPRQNETKTDKLKVNQIALIYVYESLQITRENADEIAAEYGYKSKESGEGLFQDYSNYCSTANRKGKPTPCTPKKLKNKIKLFESVVNYLSDSNKQRAIDEIKILNTIFENEYQ